MKDTVKSFDSRPVSFWEAKAGHFEINPHLVGDINADIAIIGAGFTGLSAAREIKKDNPGASVVVLEADYTGYGASGRNGGFNMTLFGLEPETTIWRWGKERAKAAQHYMTRAVNYVNDLIKVHGLDSDYQHTGMLRVAYSPPQLKRLEEGLNTLHRLGLGSNYQFRSGEDLHKDFASPRFLAGVYERNTGILNPFKHVRELKRLAEDAGAVVYEKTPVTLINDRGAAIVLSTPRGRVRSKKLVIAVNAWAHLIKGLSKIRSRAIPVWTSQIVTAPVPDEKWTELGWHDREAIEDNRQLIHYFRRTVCGRITMGGGNVAHPEEIAMGRQETKKAWDDLEAHLKWLFPTLKDIPIDYRWGGPVSVNMDTVPEIGFIGDRRIIYSLGCMGHGVSLAQLNGRTIADLVLEKKTDLAEFWIINRNVIPWPPGFLGRLTMLAVVALSRLGDSLDERKLDKSPAREELSACSQRGNPR